MRRRKSEKQKSTSLWADAQMKKDREKIERLKELVKKQEQNKMGYKASSKRTRKRIRRTSKRVRPKIQSKIREDTPETKPSIREKLDAFVVRQKGKEEARRIFKRFRALEKRELTREDLKLDDASRKLRKEYGKPELHTVKVVAVIVRVNGELRLKIQNGESPEVAPCEEFIRRITFEKEGIYASSLLREASVFTKVLVKYISRGLFRE